MKIKSNRQFRNYVIGWFLIVAGLIVAAGGYLIYLSIEDYLYQGYKTEKKTLLTSVASLIGGKNFEKVIRSKSTSSNSYREFSTQIKDVFNADDHSSRLFVLKVDSQTGNLRYVSDSVIAARDEILISNDKFEIKLSKNESGTVRIVDEGKFVTQKSFYAWENQVPVNLREKQGKLVLEIAGVNSLVFNSPNSLQSQFRNIRLASKNTKAQFTQLNVSGKQQEFSFRYIKSGTPFYTNGDFFFEKSALVSALKTSLIGTGEAGSFSFKDDPKSELYVFSPIKTKNGSIGLIVIQVSQMTQLKLQNGLIQPITFGLSILAVCWMIAAIVIARKITNPMEQLTIAIARLIQHDFNFKLSPKNFGSFGFLANQFNMMLMRLQKSRTELIHLNKSYSRFVPHQLLKQLSAGGVNDISLGDSCERKMTVLFCDIRGFTSLSETMSPAANFRFINRYLSQIAPVINKHGGIIDKYLGDGIMALFPNGADDALSAAIGMLESLDNYNKKLRQNKLPIIEVGLGLHTGNTMLGTVGTSSRMDATVISDTVNAAARVESMTKAFATKILITEETKKDLSDLNKYRIRYIASCRIQGKSKPVTLYEVFNNDTLSLQREKLQNQSLMIQAWKAYKDGDSARAIQMYQRLIEKSPHDKSLFALIERCQSGRL